MAGAGIIGETGVAGEEEPAGTAGLAFGVGPPVLAGTAISTAAAGMGMSAVVAGTAAPAAVRVSAAAISAGAVEKQYPRKATAPFYKFQWQQAGLNRAVTGMAVDEVFISRL